MEAFKEALISTALWFVPAIAIAVALFISQERELRRFHMSHITKIKTKKDITSLDRLEAACRRLGTVELVRDATKHRFYAGNLAPCEHKIRVLNNDEAYEIGVVKDGNKWALNADFFLGGKGLREAVGSNASRLLQSYAVLEAVEIFQLNGFALAEQTTLPDGTIKCVFEI